jgi:hypothetical protein
MFASRAASSARIRDHPPKSPLTGPLNSYRFRAGRVQEEIEEISPLRRTWFHDIIPIECVHNVQFSDSWQQSCTSVEDSPLIGTCMANAVSQAIVIPVPVVFLPPILTQVYMADLLDHALQDFEEA